MSAPARSYLFAPGNREELLGKVFSAGADAVVLDLEDAVPPAEKNRARDLVRRALAARDPGQGPAIWVRVNSLESELWALDLEAVVRPGLTGVRVPKSESAQRLEELSRQLVLLEKRLGMRVGSVAVTCTIESAAGLLAASELARIPRVRNLAFGEADFVADIGADPTAGPHATLMARSRLVVASRAAGIAPPIASVYTRLEDEKGLEMTTREAREMGYFGRSCIHPRQLEVIHRVFTPSPEELQAARDVVATYERAEAAGAGVVVAADGQFVDPAVVRRARSLLSLAERLALEKTGESK